MDKKKKIVIIGANDFQNQLILKAKEKGYETHVFAWAEGAVGEKTADYFYPISIIEKDQILEVCRKIKPEGIISIASDLASVTVNYVAERLHLVGNGIESSLISTNKYLMRKAFEENGDPSPKSYRSDEITDDIINHMHFPLIVKPVDRSGSRGITKIYSKTELRTAVETASSISFDQKAVVEEYIEGEEFSVEYISYQGTHTFLALTKKYTTGAPHFIETGHLQPAPVEAEVVEKIKLVVEHALDTLKIKNGASHSEIMVTADGDIKIVEIGGRMGGDCIGSDLVKISTGYDFVDMVIDVACGKEPQFRKVCEPATAEIFFVFKPEDLERLAMVQEQHPEQIYRISEMMPFDGHKVVDSSTRYGYVILRKDIRNLLNIKQNKLFVSRAATGIYLILKANEFAGKQILVPANICYAAIYPIIYSGNIPVFCDVDKNTGNVTLDIISKFTNKVEAMILPHMYGNPISDIAKIKELCVENNILLIEDCASAMGAKVGDKICGSWGDYVLFSTGYSKTIDVGEGGIIFSDRSLDKEAAIYKELPEKTEQEEINDAFFSKLYRLIRNNPDQTLSKYIWTGLEDNLKKIYVNQLPGIDKKILEGLKKLDVIVSQRQSEVQLYDELILENSYVHKYKWAEGAVPWRYCLLVDEPYRRELIEYLLENNIPVSDWYPVVTPIFGIKNNFPLATEMGNQLINFPLMIGSDEIKSICNSINAFLRRKEIK